MKNVIPHGKNMVPYSCLCMIAHILIANHERKKALLSTGVGVANCSSRQWSNKLEFMCERVSCVYK